MGKHLSESTSVQQPGADRRPLTDAEFDGLIHAGQEQQYEHLLDTVDTSAALEKLKALAATTVQP